MHIVQAEKFYRPMSGATKYALNLSAQLEARGHTVIPFAAADVRNLPSPYSKFFVSALDFSALPTTSLFQKIRAAGALIYSTDAKRKMAALLREVPVDVVHLHTIYHHLSPSFLPEIKKRKIPIVMTLHDYQLLSPNYLLYHHGAVHEEDARGWYLSCIKNKCLKDNRLYSTLATAQMIFQHKIMKYYERYVDCFIAPSAFMRNKCIEHGWDARKIIELPVGVVPPKNFGGAPGQYVAYVGRLSEEKGVAVLLKAAARTPDITYKIVGDGPERIKLAAFVSTLGLRNVEFVGFQSGASLDRIIKEARLIVVPSVCYENCSLSVIEAAMVGKVVLASAIGGLPEMLPTELLFMAGNDRALTQLIEEWFAKSDAELADMGARLEQKALGKYNLVEQTAIIEDIYSRLLQGKSLWV